MTKEKLTVNELFSGIGAQRKAFERLGIPHEVVGISEIDKYAIQSYEAIFGKTKNYGDICTAPRLDYADLWTYSFPCQDISVAGRGKGINEGTRSGLLYQVQRLLEVAKGEGTLPKYLLLENVKNLVGKKFKSQFDDWLFYLDQLGYDTYWQVLNAKNYGIPQNRERVFAISIRKDLNQSFEFPKAEELTIRLKDVLEEEVDEKYYLSEKIVNRFRASNNFGPNIIGTTIGEECTRHGQRDYVYNPDKIIGALCSSDYKQPKQIGLSIRVKEATKKGYAEATIGDSINIEQPNSKTRRGRVGHGVAQTLTTSPQQVIVLEDIRIRKLTPLECWRLMGFDDEDFHKAQQSGVSNSQLYKQAGNSIVVNVLEKIFKNLIDQREKDQD